MFTGLVEYDCICGESSPKPFVAPEEAANNLIHFPQVKSLSGRWGTFSFGEVVLNYQRCCEWKDPMIVSITRRYATVWSSALDCVLVTQVRRGVKNIVHIRTTDQIQDKSQASELTYDAFDIVLKVLLKWLKVTITPRKSLVKQKCVLSRQNFARYVMNFGYFVVSVQ